MTSNLLKDLQKMPIKDHKSLIEIRNVDNWFDTGIPSLNFAIGSGMPLGYIIELLGEEKSGKTSLVCYLAKRVQELNGIAIMVQNEGDLKKSRAIELGVDWDNLIIEEFYSLNDTYTYMETQYNKIIEARESGDNTLVCQILDSISMTGNERILGGTYGKPDMGQNPLLTGQFMQRCGLKTQEAQAVTIIVNQMRENPDQFARKDYRKRGTGGGKPLAFMGGCKLMMEKVKVWDGGKGFTSRITIKNNKVGKPDQITHLAFLYDTGVVPMSGVFYALESAKKIVNRNKKSYYREKMISPFMVDKLWEDKDLHEWIVADLTEYYS